MRFLVFTFSVTFFAFPLRFSQSRRRRRKCNSSNDSVFYACSHATFANLLAYTKSARKNFNHRQTQSQWYHWPTCWPSSKNLQFFFSCTHSIRFLWDANDERMKRKREKILVLCGFLLFFWFIKLLMGYSFFFIFWCVL